MNNLRNIKQRLDELRSEIQKPEFIEGKGLSNEVNIRIFCYDAADEMTVQHFINQVKTDVTLGCHLIDCNLYHTFLELCDDIDILDEIPAMEEEDGQVFLLEQLRSAVGIDEFIEKMQYGKHEHGDVLLLTGVGDVFPFMRVHTLLQALQPHFLDIPIVVMYPGVFDGHYLKLFDKLTPNDYYRAFNLI